MGFDEQAFVLYGSTQKEALEYIRGQAAEGKPLSPKATQMFADLFDPEVDKRGRPKFSTPNWKLAECAGFLRACSRYGLLKFDKGEDWKGLLQRYSKISINTIDRTLKHLRYFYIDSYLKATVLLWDGGAIQELKIEPNITREQIEGVILLLVQFGDLSYEKAEVFFSALR